MKRRFTGARGQKIPRGDGHKTFAPAVRKGKMIVKTPAGEGSFNAFGGGPLAAAWKQPGRRFGPPPMSVNPPKRNKVIDSDGNARTAPLSMAFRHANYVTELRPVPEGAPEGKAIGLESVTAVRGRRYFKRERRSYVGELLRNPIYFAGLAPTERTRRLGVTPRQRRRIEHKENHRNAPFGVRARA